MGHFFSSKAAETPTFSAILTGSWETLAVGSWVSHFIAKFKLLQVEQPYYFS